MDFSNLKGGSTKTISQLETQIVNAQLGGVQSLNPLYGDGAMTYAEAQSQGYTGTEQDYTNGASRVANMEDESIPRTQGKHHLYINEANWETAAKDDSGRVRFFDYVSKEVFTRVYSSIHEF